MLLSELHDTKKYKAAVGVVYYRDTWLLGLAKTGDDRNNKWTFPGGCIRHGEAPQKAAEREVKEETGIKCKVVNDKPLTNDNKVAFFVCRADSGGFNDIDFNHEYKAMGWFKEYDLSGLRLYKNVRQLITAAKKAK